MLDQLGSAVPNSKQPPTIYEVPEELKKFDYNPREEHQPVAVRLGALGFDRPASLGTEQLEKYKWCCVRQLVRRLSKETDDRAPVLLQECFTNMKRLLPRIRASYSEEFSESLRDLPDDQMAETMLKDGCFVLHRLLKYARIAETEGENNAERLEEQDEDWTQVYGRCFVWQFVTRDMLLLENQIPFFVIQKLFQQLKKDGETEDRLVTGGLRLFRFLRPQKLHDSTIACPDVHHLLHLCYLSVGLTPADRQKLQEQHPRPSNEVLLELPQWIPCAKELEEAGVRFRKRKNARSFLDVNFSHGVLEIPQLELNDSSESLFRNLIAFEQTYPGTQRDVSTYSFFMNCLVTSPEDMRILGLHDILNHLNNRKLAWRFFSDIGRQVHWPADNYLVGQMVAVNRYRDSRRHKWRAALGRNYFSNPWVTMSVFAALLLLVMSVLQTFFTVYAYFKPPNPK